MDTILQQTTEPSANLEEGQVKQEGKSSDGKQKLSAQEEEKLNVVYVKDNQTDEVSSYYDTSLWFLLRLKPKVRLIIFACCR